jgi:hypothetical protein
MGEQAQQIAREVVQTLASGGWLNLNSPVQLKAALVQYGIEIEDTAEETLAALDDPGCGLILGLSWARDAAAPGGRIA